MVRESGVLIPYGRHTPWCNLATVRSYEVAMSQKSTVGNHWSSSENSSNNAWNLNFNNGNTWNNNKYNNNVVRPAVAHESREWKSLRGTVQFAYEDCCRGKTTSRQCLEYIPTANEDLDVLTDELITRTYKPSTSTCFLVRYPKIREVFAAAFRDRVIHHWICLRMEPKFELRCQLQNDVTHNCRKGYGTKTAVQAVFDGIKDVTDNYHKEAWLFKGDLVGFFMSIDKRRMCDKLLAFAKKTFTGQHKDLLLWLIEVTVMHHPEQNCMFNSKPDGWADLQCNKSLFRCEEGKGAPIGNLTTQLFANFYMSEFDGWVQVWLRKHCDKFSYTRFVDDFVVVCNDKKTLLQFINEADQKLTEMGLKLHKNKRYIQPANHGLMFVGTYIHNGRMYVSNRTLAKFREKVHGATLYLQRPRKEITIYELEHIRATINSYLGFCTGRQTYKIRKEVLRPFIKAAHEYFIPHKNWSSIKLRKKYRTIYK